ncbi:SagB/ThcOx family dehydrogenase [Streptomyces sp. NPDC088196]|uniref:SagB/ThcOx family dehydrogenase n=1 Tax=Streptomyces sp. NPDC088196 TaxID=3154868 RepID=UPI0034505CA8
MPDPSASSAPSALPPLLRIGGGLSPRDGVHVQDLAGRRRGYVDRRTLARTIAGGAAPAGSGALASWLAAAEAAPQPAEELVEFWHRRRWRPSLEYHLLSRDLPYADSGPDAVDTRREVLSGYGGGAQLPPRIRPEGRRVPLPDPLPGDGERSLGTALLTRRSVRSYLPRPTPAGALSAILRTGLAAVAANQRRTGEDDPRELLRSFGTAFDFYVLTYNVDGIDPGAWHLDLAPAEPELTEIRPGDLRGAMRQVFYGSPWPLTAAFTLVMVADFEQYQFRYRHERALRNLYIESGHLAQRLLLLADTHGLGTLVTPAVRDGLIEDLLGLDPVRQATIYTLTMGPDPRHGTRTRVK